MDEIKLRKTQRKMRRLAEDNEIIGEVMEQICGGYCKYPNTYDEEAEGTPMVDSVCKHCPIGG